MFLQELVSPRPGPEPKPAPSVQRGGAASPHLACPPPSLLSGLMRFIFIFSQRVYFYLCEQYGTRLSFLILLMKLPHSQPAEAVSLGLARALGALLFLGRRRDWMLNQATAWLPGGNARCP